MLGAQTGYVADKIATPRDILLRRIENKESMLIETLSRVRRMKEATTTFSNSHAELVLDMLNNIREL